jgi:hypothetical protein
MSIHRPALAACLALTLGRAGAIAQTHEATMTTPVAHLASDRPIGHLEPVFEFHSEMPTGVSVAADGRIFVNFPR